LDSVDLVVMVQRSRPVARARQAVVEGEEVVEGEAEGEAEAEGERSARSPASKREASPQGQNFQGVEAQDVLLLRPGAPLLSIVCK
jgi:hypothetical protein